MMVRAHASGEARCEKKREIAAAYLKENDERHYRLADVEAGIECDRVAIDRLNGTTAGSSTADSIAAESMVANDMAEIDRAVDEEHRPADATNSTGE
jgi:hypothetical protein